MPAVRVAVVAVALAAPAAGHVARALGHGYGAASALAAVQAVAVGAALWSALPPGRQVWGVVLAGVVLAALVLGDVLSPGGGLLAAAGVTHAILYGGLLVWFGGSLRTGRVSLVTGLAARVNPHFHAGLVPYTRRVTWAWCLFFAAQLAASAVLLATGEVGWWLLLVSTLHLPLVAAFAVAEFAVRRWHLRHEQTTSFRDTIRAVRSAHRP